MFSVVDFVWIWRCQTGRLGLKGRRISESRSDGRWQRRDIDTSRTLEPRLIAWDAIIPSGNPKEDSWNISDKTCVTPTQSSRAPSMLTDPPGHACLLQDLHGFGEFSTVPSGAALKRRGHVSKPYDSLYKPSRKGLNCCRPETIHHGEQ